MNYQHRAEVLDPDLRRIGSHPDHWYPLAWSRDLKPGKAIASAFGGDPIVLVRDAAGGVFALEDRCAHRQVPLSCGIVEGGGIRCGYHGWSYDRDRPHARMFPTSARAGCRTGSGHTPAKRPADWCSSSLASPIWLRSAAIPDLGPIADPRYKTRRFGQAVGCHYTFMHENLMDMNHQFLHRAQMGQIRPRYLGRRIGEDWLEIDYTFARSGGGQSLGERVIFGSTRVGGWANNRDKMTIRTDYPYQKTQDLGVR